MLPDWNINLSAWIQLHRCCIHAREREKGEILLLTLAIRSQRLSLVRCLGNLRNGVTGIHDIPSNLRKKASWQHSTFTVLTVSNDVQRHSSMRDAEAFHTLSVHVPTSYKARAWRYALPIFHVLYCEETQFNIYIWNSSLKKTLSHRPEKAEEEVTCSMRASDNRYPPRGVPKASK